MLDAVHDSASFAPLVKAAGRPRRCSPLCVLVALALMVFAPGCVQEVVPVSTGSPDTVAPDDNAAVGDTVMTPGQPGFNTTGDRPDPPVDTGAPAPGDSTTTPGTGTDSGGDGTELPGDPGGVDGGTDGTDDGDVPEIPVIIPGVPSGDGTTGGGDDGGEACLTDERFFVEKVWIPVLSQNCFACHNAFGQASHTDFVLADGYQADFLQQNWDMMEKVATYDKNGIPLLLLKPLGGDNHGGGVRLVDGSEELQALEELLDRFQSPSDCTDPPDLAPVLESVVLADGQATLRKAVLSLADRLPTESEQSLVATDGSDGLITVLETVMTEPAFNQRMREIFDDIFQVTKYAHDDDAIDLLDDDDYPDKDWYKGCNVQKTPLCVNQFFKDTAKAVTNDSVANEPLELALYLIANDLPFSEILTADYVMVNPYSARTYGVEVLFNDPTSPNEWKPTQVSVPRDEGLVDIPHAGVLSSPIWLNRYPTTDTNVNRHRSSSLHKQFLATDIEKLASRPVDLSTIVAHNPTTNELACAICHATVDPVAGTFQNFDEGGRYLPPSDGWNYDMRPPGFGPEIVGNADQDASLQWLAGRVVEDRRFSTAMVRHMFKGFTGLDPLDPPTDPTSSNYIAELEAFLQQDAWIKAIADAFEADGERLKTVILGILLGPYYRAVDVPPGTVAGDKTAEILVDQLGTSHLLTPEQLSRRLESITGHRWLDEDGEEERLLAEFLPYYGGVDRKYITRRVEVPNGTMMNVAERMSHEMACQMIMDFTLAAEERAIFPYVEMGYAPTDSFGFLIPEAIGLIKQNISHLHQHLLGENLTGKDLELQRTYELFEAVQSAGRDEVYEGYTDAYVPESCQHFVDPFTGEELPPSHTVFMDETYTVRAWMAVLSYLMTDYFFLFE